MQYVASCGFLPECAVYLPLVQEVNLGLAETIFEGRFGGFIRYKISVSLHTKLLDPNLPHYTGGGEVKNLSPPTRDILKALSGYLQAIFFVHLIHSLACFVTKHRSVSEPDT